MRPTIRPRLAATAGYSLVELLISMGLLTIIVGATLGGLANVMKGNETVMTIAAMNNSVRAGLDLMVRDLLQVGSGLPSSHTVSIPNGAGSTPLRMPGPPGSAFQTEDGDLVLPAVIPRSGQGPSVNGIATDVLTFLMADNAFLDIQLTAVADSSVVVAINADGFPDLEAGPDRVTAGQLMMISKGSYNTLVQVTDVDPLTRTLTFDDDDSLRLNQAGAANGSLPALNAQDPVDDATATRISRLRMITYYLDDTEADHPRLVRRVNAGDPLLFDNTLGTAVALDAVDLQFAYDISNGSGNPGNVEMTDDDLDGTGACNPSACAPTQIRKVNILLTSQSLNPISGVARFLTNTLQSQVALRSMAFVDRYR